MAKNLIKNSSILLSSQVFIMIIGLVTQIIMARLLLPEGRGVYALCVVYSSFILLFTNFGNEFGIRFLFLKNRTGISEAFAYIVFTAFVSIVISYGVLHVGYSYASFDSISKISYQQFSVAILFCATNFISKQINVLLTISKQFRNAAALSLVEEFLKLILLFVALSYYTMVEVAFLAVTLGNVIAILFYIFKFKLLNKRPTSFCFSDLRFVYNYGLKNFFFSFSNLANGHLGTLILSLFLSNDKIGIYSVAYGLVSRFQFIPDTLNRLFVPISNDARGKDIDILKLFSSFLFLVFFFVVLLILLLGNKIILIMFGVEYLEAGLLIKIFSIGFLFKVMSKPLEAYYNEIKGRPGVISIINGFSLLSFAVCMSFMSKYYGLVGASIATSFIMFLTYFVIVKFFIAQERVSFVSFLNVKQVLIFIKKDLL